MIVAGGTYAERCIAPASEQLMGSGGRALLALPPSIGAVLHTFHPDAEEILANFGGSAVVHPADGLVRFDYLHPLSRPRISPVPLPVGGSVDVAGSAVLRFGCLEGNFRVDADVAVYDPQNGGRSDGFRANGSRAGRLAIVANAAEAAGMAGGGSPEEAGATLLMRERADVVVVKLGPAGALVLGGGERVIVPAYRSESVFKIGSGDVFSAMFALHWAIGGIAPAEAADRASRQTAAYVGNQVLPCPPPDPHADPVTGTSAFEAVLTVDGHDLAAAWLVAEARGALLATGARWVLDAIPPATRGVPTVMLAIAREPEGAALAGAAAARDAGIPTVVFAQRDDVAAAAARLGLTIGGDLTGAVYAAAWAAR